KVNVMWQSKALLLITLVVGGASALAQSTSTPPTTGGTTSPSATQKLDQMLNTGAPSARPLPAVPVAPRAINSATTRPGVSPGSPAMSVLREGTLIRDRTGRLARSADGSQVEFVFDADRDALQDPPVIILPNLKLM